MNESSDNQSRVVVAGICISTILFAIIISGFFNTQIPKQPSGNGGNPIRIAVTLPVFADFATRLHPDQIKVKSLVPAGVEPHEYEPTPDDRITLENSDLILSVGSGFDGWLENLVTAIPAGRRPQILNLGGALGLEPDADPHFWLDNERVIEALEIIAERLIDMSPSAAQDIGMNQELLQNELIMLDNDFDTTLRTCKQKSYISAHTAFHLLTNPYNIRDIPLSGYDPEQEPSSAQIASVIRTATELNTRVIFIEPLIRPKIVDALIRDLGTIVYTLDPLENTDDLTNFSYEQVMRDNLTTLAKALDCTISP